MSNIILNIVSTIFARPVQAPASTDDILTGNFLTDENGNFLTDENGNYLMMD